MKHLNNIYYFIDKFESSEILKLDKQVNIIYRNYKEKYKTSTISKIKQFCKSTKRKFYLANDIKLVLKLGLDGIYIPSFNKSLKAKYIRNRKIEILGSVHNYKEVIIKKRQGVNKFFISPVFKVKKNKNFLGIIKYNFFSQRITGEKIALGGVNKKNFNQLKLLKCDGYAAIRLFKYE